MTSRGVLSNMSAREQYELFKAWGFEEDRTTGGHTMMKYTNGDGVTRTCPVPSPGRSTRANYPAFRQGASIVGVPFRTFVDGPAERVKAHTHHLEEQRLMEEAEARIQEEQVSEQQPEGQPEKQGELATRYSFNADTTLTKRLGIILNHDPGPWKVADLVVAAQWQDGDDRKASSVQAVVSKLDGVTRVDPGTYLYDGKGTLKIVQGEPSDRTKELWDRVEHLVAGKGGSCTTRYLKEALDFKRIPNHLINPMVEAGRLVKPVRGRVALPEPEPEAERDEQPEPSAEVEQSESEPGRKGDRLYVETYVFSGGERLLKDEDDVVWLAPELIRIV